MRNLFLLVAVAFCFTACEKEFPGKFDKFGKDESKAGKAEYEKYIYEDLVYSPNCDCIVAGKVKYLKHGITVALVDYGNGTCDNEAEKTICKHGKCEPDVAETETFTFECGKDDLKEGEISEKEAKDLGLF